MTIFGAKLAVWTLLPNERQNKVELGDVVGLHTFIIATSAIECFDQMTKRLL